MYLYYIIYILYDTNVTVNWAIGEHVNECLINISWNEILIKYNNELIDYNFATDFFIIILQSLWKATSFKGFKIV